MNAQIQTAYTQRPYPNRKTRLVIVLAIALWSHMDQSPAADGGNGNYDENVLFSPSKAVLLAEKRGRVTIYDGLEHRVVDRALDTQFGRIDNMMFVRTRESLPDGSLDIDDDCD